MRTGIAGKRHERLAIVTVHRHRDRVRSSRRNGVEDRHEADAECEQQMNKWFF